MARRSGCLTLALAQTHWHLPQVHSSVCLLFVVAITDLDGPEDTQALHYSGRKSGTGARCIRRDWRLVS